MEPATATGPYEIGLMSFNVCGGVCRDGEVTRTARQLAAVTELVGRRADRPAIVGGDFNTIPGDPGLARMYSPSVGGSGRFTELDETRNGNPEMGGAATFAHRKIDYMFLSEGHFTHQRAETVSTRYSDHRIYLGRAQPVPDGP
jgi:endonuclease/exonuclease/phosphatase family metal-dependent hydrolase